ncbi:Signal transduction histidine kinase [Pedobacter antarcticus]|nr:Signal transduction histidine kinase [Pedobacter antarcticus]SFE87336.1 Signal transduction histidine kinase [Pedobacter antarcticus]
MLVIRFYMQISSKEIVYLISIITVIFLIAPIFIIIYVSLYNRRKKNHIEETIALKKTFDNELLKAQIEVKEQTLQTLAVDLHDNIGQLLGLTIATLSSINLNDQEKAATKINSAEQLAKRSVKEIRALSRLLHGEELLSRGLIAAITFELEWVQKSELFKITFDTESPEINLPPDKLIIVFRLFQETLNNILKHAQATSIFVTVKSEMSTLTLVIKDNGIGFNIAEIASAHKGIGLSNMTRRANMIGGSAFIDSSPALGTTITFTIPC